VGALMKKLLIIASCGLVLTLIIGAISQPKSSIPMEEINLINHRQCQILDKMPNKFECLDKQIFKLRSEKFLRKIQRKIRIAYV
jgi:hypothetical protein